MTDQLIAFKKQQKELAERFRRTRTECGDQVEKLKNFISDLTVIVGCISDSLDLEKAKQSLVFYRFLQSILHLKELPFLLMAAHYTSGIQILRYHLESMIQAFYLDQQHPTFSFENKICILTEISDKTGYFVARLINRLPTGYKKNIRKMYKELSIASHPSHLDFPTIKQMMGYLKNLESSVDCEELNRVVDLTIQTYDIIFFLVLQDFPTAKEVAKDRADIKKVIEKYNLSLLNNVL